MEVNHFSVIASVYGVEKYLDEFFISIVNQTIGFGKHIELIVVDDGSIDGSANIISKWQAHYPDNIKCIYKQNGGLSSARNEGLKHVSTNWVSFIDPDDFIDEDYFEVANMFLKNNQEHDVGMMSCNIIYYLEGEDRFSNTHPLAFRFKENETILTAPKLESFFQLSVNSTFLRVDVIKENSLQMDVRITPTFEDAHFIGRYLSEIDGYKVVFLKNAKYYYRKRQDNTSLIDTSWNKREQYTTKLKLGYLDLLKRASNSNVIPEYIQRTVLYDLVWYVKHIVNRPERLNFLTSKDKSTFIDLLKKIFSYIDPDVINGFNLAGCWFFHKVGMLGFFKGSRFPFQIVYIEGYDPVKDLVLLKYFYYGDVPQEAVYFDVDDVLPVFQKTRTHDFLDNNFVNERILWVPLNHVNKTITFKVADFKTRLSLAGKHYHEGVETRQIVNYFAKKELNDRSFPESISLLRKLARSAVKSEPYIDAWLFMDRDTQADDNAEHLYCYISKQHPEVNAYFILRDTSHDWERLQKEGFRLLNFGSRDHKLALLNAKHLISSHADQYVTDYMPKNWFGDLLNFHYTFLQHGITKDDISNWLNSKQIDLFITATEEEYASIAGDSNRYKFSSKEVSLLGFPRHDALLKLNETIATEKLIVIMPTWREGIVGKTTGQGNNRDLNEDFYLSDYAKAWKSFLLSNHLEQQATKYGYKIIFFPHANIQPYLGWFDTPEYVKTISHVDIDSIQHLFSRASILITDYSSVAFEMAYLYKAVIYYQFDYDYVFNGGHLTKMGYFDYNKNGFGPVCATQSQVLDELFIVLENSGLSSEYYLERMKSAFAYKDRLCCERVYTHINKLQGEPK